MRRLLIALADLSLAALAAAGCGGTDGVREPVDAAPTVAIGADPGSGPADCTSDDRYEFRIVPHADPEYATFETGAATGWYSNNETCDACSLLQAALCEQFTVTAADEAGVSNSGSPVDAGSSGPAPEGGTAVDPCASPVVCRVAPDLADSTAALCKSHTGTNCPRLVGEPPPATRFGGPYDPGCAGVPAEVSALSSCLAACRTAETPAFENAPNAPDPMPAELIANGGRCGSQYAMHITGGPFTDWGISFGRSFSNTPVDASNWEGVSFWARVVPGSAQTAQVTLTDEHTDSTYNKSLPVSERHCNPNSGLTDSKTGCDKFGGYFTAGPDWQFFDIPFTEMRQGGWGAVQPPLDLANLLSLELDFKGAAWDVWIDDIALYRRKAQ